MTRAQVMWVKHGNTPQYHKGNLVWLEGHNLHTNQPTAKLTAQHHGPFPVEQVLSPVTYKLSLPSTWNVHPVFHTDLLTPYRETSFHGKSYQRPQRSLSRALRSMKLRQFWTCATMEGRRSVNTWSSGRGILIAITNGWIMGT